MTEKELIRLRYLLDLYLLFELDECKLEDYYYLLDSIDYKIEAFVKEKVKDYRKEVK